MDSHHIQAVLSDLPELKISSAMTEEDAMTAMRVVAQFNQCMIGMVRFSGQTPWERHPDDELLQVLQGEVDVTVLTDTTSVEVTIGAGSLFIVPKGLWHRQKSRPTVALLFTTSMEGNETSTAEDPRAV